MLLTSKLDVSLEYLTAIDSLISKSMVRTFMHMQKVFLENKKLVIIMIIIQNIVATALNLF